MLSEEDIGIIKELIGLAKRIIEDDPKLKVLAELLMRYIAQGISMICSIICRI